MYSPPNGFGFPGALDYSQSFGSGLSNRLSGFAYGAQNIGSVNDAQVALFDRHNQLTGCGVPKIGATSYLSSDHCPSWPGAGLAGCNVWPSRRYSDSSYSQVYGVDLNSASGRRTVIDDVRVHPYHRLNKLTAWHELNQAVACSCCNVPSRSTSVSTKVG